MNRSKIFYEVSRKCVTIKPRRPRPAIPVHKLIIQRFMMWDLSLSTLSLPLWETTRSVWNSSSRSLSGRHTLTKSYPITAVERLSVIYSVWNNQIIMFNHMLSWQFFVYTDTQDNTKMEQHRVR